MLAAVALVLLLGGIDRPADAQAQAPAAGAGFRLVDQTAIVSAGQPFTIAFAPNGFPPDATLSVVLHDRVRSRSELARAIKGEGLRSARSSVTMPLASIPPRSDGSVSVTLPTDGSAGGIDLGPPGVYPVTLAADGPDGDEVRLVTQLVVPPPTDGTAPPLDVAVLAVLGTPPATGTELPVPIDADALRHLGTVVTALQAIDSPLTLDVGPDTLVSLARSDDPVALGVLDQIRALGARHTVLTAPYVRVSPDALAAAQLDAELQRDLFLGATAGQLLSIAPIAGYSIEPPGLARRGLALLTAAGIDHLVLTDQQLETTTDGVLTLARPFRVVPQPERGVDDRDLDVQAMVIDRGIDERLASNAEPAAIGVQVVAELAALWFEQPTTHRAAILRIDASTAPEAVVGLREAIAGSSFLRAVDLPTAFDDAAPLVDGRGRARPLELAKDAEVVHFNPDTVDSIRVLRAQQQSLATLLAADDPVLGSVDADILKAEAAGLSTQRRQAHLRDARTRIGTVVGGVTTAGTSTVTLTARKGSVPLTFVNSSGSAMAVVLHLRSSKLELPGGTTVPLDLPPGATRVNIDIVTRASGSIPLEVEVVSPDGRLLLTTARYSVQSTAVSGVGIVLSAGAMVFLLVWWGRHWREHRRATKLVTVDEPSE
jgi:hypothetical protein